MRRPTTFADYERCDKIDDGTADEELSLHKLTSEMRGGSQ
jgi:hypothetical protein